MINLPSHFHDWQDRTVCSGGGEDDVPGYSWSVAYLLLGELGDAPPFGFFEQFWRCASPPLGSNILGEVYM